MGELKIQYSDKKITPWGGMKLLKDFMDHLGVMSHLGKLPLPYPESNRGYDPKTVILGFWLSIILNRMIYLESGLKCIFRRYKCHSI